MTGVVARQLPPPRYSWLNRLSPLQITAMAGGVATVLGAVSGIMSHWQLNAEEIAKVEAATKDIVTLNTKLDATMQELERLRKAHGELSDAVNYLRNNEANYRTFADASFCALGVLPPYGCPDVEYAPRPLKNSSAHPIQPRVKVEPLIVTP